MSNPMEAKHDLLADPRIRTAIEEIRGLISDRYPDATFSVGLGHDPDGVYLRTVVDVDDRGDVFDAYIARLTDIQDDDHLPLYVIPTRPPERNAAILRAQSRTPLSSAIASR